MEDLATFHQGLAELRGSGLRDRLVWSQRVEMGLGFRIYAVWVLGSRVEAHCRLHEKRHGGGIKA